MISPGQQSVLFFDGTCPLCSGAVRFLLKHEKRNDLKFSPLNSPYAGNLFRRFPDLKQIDSIVFIEGNEIFVRSDAVRRSFRYLGGWWKILLIFWILPKPLLDRLYDTIAQRRHTLFGKESECAIPTNKSRSRFIE
jgi:predicted DCC family thiol-disulfide oxidoreductase YuxK